jgi:hypothetical protein
MSNDSPMFVYYDPFLTHFAPLHSAAIKVMCHLPCLIICRFSTAGRRNARGSNVVLRRFMVDLLNTVSSQYVMFISEEYRGTYDQYQRERQYHLLHRKIIRWFINNH